MLGVNASGTDFISEQISLIYNVNSLITFQEREGDIFDNRVLNISGNLSLYTKVKMSGVKTVKATILLVSGEKVELITSVTL